MPDHLRKQIRDAAEQLLNGMTTTQDRVFNSRLFQVQQNELPCWNIKLGTETHDIEARTLEGNVRRILQIFVDGYVRDMTGAAAADQADLILKEFEQRWATDETLGGLLESSIIEEIDTEDDSEETDAAFVGVRITIIAVYWTHQSAPDVPLPVV